MPLPVRPNPAPARARAVTMPSAGSSRSGQNGARNVTAITCALASTKVWFDKGSVAASACAIANIQPVMPPIFMVGHVRRRYATRVRPFPLKLDPVRREHRPCLESSTIRSNRWWGSKLRPYFLSPTKETA